MIFYSEVFNIKKITTDQKQTPCTNTTKEIKDVANENEGSDADDEDNSCDDYNSKCITMT